MTITLTPQTEARLRKKAEREGQDINTIADALITAALEWEAEERARSIAPPQPGAASAPEARSRRREIGRRLDALGPEYRASPQKQARAEELLARKVTLTPGERAELDELRREFDEIMLRRAEAIERVL